VITNLNELPLTTPAMVFVILTVVAIAIGLEQLTAWIWPPTGMLSYCCC
jgi:asparagine N-glycosylation enzyme membrane subunit Stt3